MARRKKPCEFCEQDMIESFDNESRHQLCVEWYPENGLFAITSYGDDAIGEADELQFSMNFEYCPMCGRKLAC